MKTIFSNPQEIAHIWAHQSQQEAKNSNRSFFFYGDTIYSYGHHFPIAKHNNGVILFTLKSYSVTTSKHIQIVRSASSHKDKLFCYELPINERDISAHTQNLDIWVNNIKGNIKKLKTTKKPEIYISNINNEINLLICYQRYFNLKLTKEQKEIVSIKDKDGFLSLLKKEEKAKELFNKQILTKGKSIYNKSIEAWKQYRETNFKENLTDKEKSLLSSYKNLTDLNLTYLRSNETEIETSKGIHIPLEVARRFYTWFNSVKVKGCTECNKEILGYSVNSANENGLIVGCHNVNILEITQIAKKNNW